MDTNLPTCYIPLDVLVARCRLPIKVTQHEVDYHGLHYRFEAPNTWPRWANSSEEAHRVYAELVAYLQPAPERGGIVDMEA